MNAGDEFFDASQYAFFGGNVSEEVELGGLDEEDGGEQLEDGEDSLDAIPERDGVIFQLMLIASAQCVSNTLRGCYFKLSHPY